MAFNGSGTYNLPAGNPVVTGTTISSTTTNTTFSDIATALTNCITRDGQSTPSANLPMNSKKLTGLAAGTSAGDSVRYEQVVLTGGSLASCTGLSLTTGVTGTLPVNNGGTGATSLTANSVLLGNGTSALQAVAPGASGNALISNGTTWASSPLASSAMVLISSVNAVGASTVSFTGLSSAYSTYILKITNWTPSTNNSNIYFRTSTNNGATYDNSASNYTWVTAKFDNSSVTHSGSSVATEIRLDTGNNATANQGGTSGSILIANPSAAAYTNVLFDLVLLNGSSVFQRVIGAGTRTQTSGAVNAVQLFPGSGTVTARCNLYGLINS